MFQVRPALLTYWLFAVLVGGGCKSDDDGDDVSDDTTGPTDDTDDTDRPLLGERFELTIDASLGRRMTWPSATLPMFGQVLDLDGVGLPGQVDWEVVPAGGTSSAGTGSIGPEGTWTAEAPLASGDNTATVSIPGTPATLELQITHNDGYTFGGPLTLTKTVAYVGETRTLEAEILLTDTDTDPLTVTVVQVDGSGQETPLGALTDDGDATNGDDIGGDLLFHGAFDVLGSTVGDTLQFRVVVTRPSGGEARSELRDVRIHEHIDPVEFVAQIDAGRAFEERMLAAPESERQTVLEEIQAELSQDPDVVVAEFNDSRRGVWFVYTNGVAGVVDIPVEGEKSAPGLPAPFASQRAAPPDNEVGGSRVKMIAAQYWDWGDDDDIPQMEQMLLDQGCIGEPETNFQTFKNGGSVEQFKNLGNYGLVFVSTHGDSFFDVPGDWLDQFEWNGPLGQVILHTNHLATEANLAAYEDDLKAGRLVVWYDVFGITPDFVRTYAGRRMLNSFVYISACRGTWNGSMASAFLESGAGAYFGYSDYVAVDFTVDVGIPFLEDLLVEGTTVGDAFVPGQIETDPEPNHAEFKMFGATDLELALTGLQDGGFESGNIQASWGGGLGASAVSSWYGNTPTEGRYMGLITTGLGDAGPAISSQTWCLGSDDHTLVFDWNLFTDEEQTGGDIFSLFINAETEEPPYYLHETILFIETDELTDSDVVDAPGVILTPERCDEDPCVKTTGWRTVSLPLDTAWHDRSFRMTISVVGGPYSNTAVLMDDIHFVP